MNKKTILAITISTVSYFLFLFIIYYFCLPVINFTHAGFYVYLALIACYLLPLVFILRSKTLVSKNKDKKYKQLAYDRIREKFYFKEVTSKNHYKPFNLIIKGVVLSVSGLLVLLAVFGIIGSKMFNAKAYYKQLEVTEGPEEELLETFDFNNGEVLLPIIDKDLAYKLAQASLGDYGAQYTIDYDNFTLINVTRNGVNELVRIAPLEYSNIFVSLSKHNEGSVGYIEVNVVTK